MLVELGYQRKGTWFTKCPPGSRFFICLNLRKIPQIATKRTVFQVVSYAGIRPTAQTFAISSLAQALSLSSFEHHMIDNQIEKFWTVWPSTNVDEMLELLITQIRQDSIVALEEFIST